MLSVDVTQEYREKHFFKIWWINLQVPPFFSIYIYFLVSLNKDRSLNLCRNVNFFHKKSGKIKFNGKLGTCSLKMLKWKSELTLKICCMVVIKLLLQFMSISWIFLLMFCNLPVLHSGIDCVKDLHPENGSWQVVAWKR